MSDVGTCVRHGHVTEYCCVLFERRVARPFLGPAVAAVRAAMEFDQAVATVAVALDRDPSELRDAFRTWLRTVPLTSAEGADLVVRRGEIPKP